MTGISSSRADVSRRPWRALRWGAAVLVVLVALSCGPEPWTPLKSVEIDGRQVHLSAQGQPLRRLLVEAGIRLPQGEVRAAHSGRVVERADGIAPRVWVNGRTADLDAPLRSGARVRLAAGSATEPTTVAYVAADVPFVPGTEAKTLRAGTVPGVEAGMPDVMRKLWRPGRAALRRALIGERSQELVADMGVVPGTAPTEEQRPLVALTFDDGPDPTWTPQILNILEQEGVPATFCVVGNNVGAYPALVARERAMGEVLCDHTMTHDQRLDRKPLGTISYEIGQGANVIEQVTGVRPHYYRPPGGTLSPAIVSTALGLGLRVLFWSVDTSDYTRPPPETLVRRVLTEVTPGAIVLFHDGGGDRSRTVAALRPLIHALRDRGYRFTTPSAESPPPPPPQPPVDKLR